jgi:hypothetical protein
MRQTRATLDRIATLAALRLLAWVGKYVDPAHQLWLDALRAELDAIDGGIARLIWVVRGLRLVWFERRRSMLNATYRYGPVLLPWLEVALFVGLTWSLIRQYGSLVVSLLVLAGLGLVVALPVLIFLVHAIRASVTAKWGTRQKPLRRVRPLLPFVLSVISLAMLLALWLSAPVILNQLLGQQGLATAGAVVDSGDHQAAEAVFEQTGSLSHAEVYLTTQVKPLAVNGIPLAQLLQSQPPGPWQNNDLQVLINKFTGLQGYDLAHRQFLNTMGFVPELGQGGPGPSGSGTGPPGRLLGAHDAGTFNVLIPRDFGGLSYLTYNGDTITVQSLVTRQTVGTLRAARPAPAV